jgi:2-iminoacetate synthase
MSTNNTQNETNFIDHDYVEQLLRQNQGASAEEIREILEESKSMKGLTHDQVAKLIHVEDPQLMREIFAVAGSIKQKIYGNRVVMFAPLYISNYCVNNCTYCGYQHQNKFARRKLKKEEIEQDVKLLEKMGHKRIALEVGEDPINSPIGFVLDAIDTIYNTENENGSIRRINVNIAATTVDEYKMLKDANIGTYILFQETYHRPTYKEVHPKSVKGNYTYHLNAFDRAMTAGLDDVGGGVLFGLYDYKFETLSLMLHNEHLENTFGVGFHTISVPRLKKAEGMTLDQFKYLITDDQFKKIVAVLRLAVPFTGIIMSTRETQQIREEVIDYGVSQVSAGSQTGVGGYSDNENGQNVSQFEAGDHRTPIEIVKSLLTSGYLPSYCTACYRSGRTGDRFMQLAKSGQIGNVCQPNALMTLMEFILDYGDEELDAIGRKTIYETAERIPREEILKLTLENLKKIEGGSRDLFL